MSDGLKNVRKRHDDALSRLDGERLRALLAEYYRRQGYRVDAVEAGAPASAGDSAGPEFDLRLHREDSRLLVRCLHWTDKQVPHQCVRPWLDALAYEDVNGSIFATSGEFTPSAIRTASLSKTLRLVDGDELRKMLLPLLDVGFDADIPTDEVGAFADMDFFPEASPTHASPIVASRAQADAAMVDAAMVEDRKDSVALATDENVETLADASAHRQTKRAVLWERGSRPASNMSIAVAGVLLTLIVLTIVFRDRLDPYLGEPQPQVAAPKRNESPLAGTDYKSDVFDPAIRAQDEPVGEKPKPKRPDPPRAHTNQPTPDEAIRVIERTTPEMHEQPTKKAPSEK
jgi:hypothetical protein